MKTKVFFIVLLFTVVINAQMERVWERSLAQSNLYSWFSPTGNTERGLAYGNVGGNDRVYVVSRNVSPKIQILNANDGSEVGTLSTTGIAGGAYVINDIEVSQDGVIFAMNLTTDNVNTKIYKWTSETAVPVAVFDNNLGGAKRVGDNFHVIGKVSDNSVKIWAADVTNKKVYILGTTDNGTSFSVEQTITLPANSMEGDPSVYPVDSQSFVLNCNGKNVTKWDMSGNLLGTIPGSQVGTGSNAIMYYVNNNVPYVVTFQYGATTENARILMVGNDISKAITYVVTNSMFHNDNPNGTGDIAIKHNGDGTQTIFVLSTNNGIGAFKISYPHLINGRLNEPYNDYCLDEDSNAGFGADINVDGLYVDMDNEALFIGLDSYLNTTSSDGIVLFVGSSKLAGTGVAAGMPLGGVTSGGHLFGDQSNPNFCNDFETHYGFAINPGSSNSAIYIDAVQYSNGQKTAQYIGTTTQNGTLGQGPEADGIFANNSVKFAFYNTHDVKRGWEIKIPLEKLGNPTNADEISVFAAVVSSTGYFSDVTVPGTITTGNIGFNPNFATLAGGPFHLATAIVPVELTSFKASCNNGIVNLSWQTATETNNRGFYIQRSIDGVMFNDLSFVNGKGNSTEISKYEFIDNNTLSGNIYYRLKQVDYDGTVSFSNVVEVSNTMAEIFELSQNYPNPFNPSTTIKFTVPQVGIASLTVYNSLGEKVSELFNQVAQNGNMYSISFDGSKLSSGVYFYQLTQGSFSSVKKMMLIK